LESPSLTLFNVWRIPAALAFFWYGAQGLPPPLFVRNAAWSDLIAGAAAIPVVLWLMPRPTWRRTSLLAFHLFSFADFVVAVGTGFIFSLLGDPTGHCVEIVSCTLEFAAAGASAGTVVAPGAGTAVGGVAGGVVGFVVGAAIAVGVGAGIGYLAAQAGEDGPAEGVPDASSGETTTDTGTTAAGQGEQGKIPPIVYREGKPNPGNLTPREKDQGDLSTRDSIQPLAIKGGATPHISPW
jgi:hypothetical protein